MAARGDTYIEFDQKYFDEIMRSAGVKSLQLDVGREALGRAKATAPVKTGGYRDGLRLRWVPHRYRDTLILEGTDPRTLLVESQTGHLARTLKSIARR